MSEASVVANCSAILNGGGFASDSSTVILSLGSRIEACSVAGSGGGALIDESQLRLIGGSSISLCTAFEGGGLAIASASALFNEAFVSGCIASAGGGAFWMRGARMTLLNCVVREPSPYALPAKVILKPTVLNASLSAAHAGGGRKRRYGSRRCPLWESPLDFRGDQCDLQAVGLLACLPAARICHRGDSAARCGDRDAGGLRCRHAP